MTPSSRILGVLIALCAGAPAPGASRPRHQDVPSEYERITRALHVVRQGRVEREEKERAMEQLLTLGLAGPQRLADHLRRQGEGLAKEVARELPRFQERFLAYAVRLGESRLDARAEREVQEARQAVRGNARRGDLTKEQIRSTSDPAMARLESLLVVTVEEVLEAEPKLAEDHQELTEVSGELRRTFAWWRRAEQALARHPEGARAHARLKALEDPGDPAAALAAELAFLARLATPMSASAREVLQDNRVKAAAIGPREAAGILHLNLMRLRLGLGVLAVDVRLCQASRGHSKDMHELGFFSHTSPVEGKRSVGDRARQAGTSAGAENIAVGAETGEDVIRQWWYSPGHHRNMLGGHSRIGLGRHQRHWTQMFG